MSYKVTLFIYYSLSGNGDAVANYFTQNSISTRKIIPVKSLPKNFALRIMTGGFLASIGYRDKLVNFDNDITKYDEIIIGSPIWNDRLSTPVNSALSCLNLSNKKLTFILYSGRGYAKNATEKINKLYPQAKIINLKEPKKYPKDMLNILKNI